MQHSGAYVFRPSNNTPVDTHVVKVEKAEFAGFTEFRLTLNIHWAKLVVRRARRQEGDEEDGEEVEVDWHVGPIDGEKQKQQQQQQQQQ